jgi:hypothetical protein
MAIAEDGPPPGSLKSRNIWLSELGCPAQIRSRRNCATRAFSAGHVSADASASSSVTEDRRWVLPPPNANRPLPAQSARPSRRAVPEPVMTRVPAGLKPPHHPRDAAAAPPIAWLPSRPAPSCPGARDRSAIRTPRHDGHIVLVL